MEGRATTGTWDRNYNDTALEVKNPEGHIVLQISLLDVVQIQGAWPLLDPQMKAKFEYVVVRSGSDRGAQFILRPPNSLSPWPTIDPMFEYPSDLNLGKLAAQKH